jgi:hypothetical protein
LPSSGECVFGCDFLGACGMTEAEELKRLARVGANIAGSDILRLVETDLPGLVYAIRLVSKAAASGMETGTAETVKQGSVAKP